MIDRREWCCYESPPPSCWISLPVHILNNTTVSDDIDSVDEIRGYIPTSRCFLRGTPEPWHTLADWFWPDRRPSTDPWQHHRRPWDNQTSTVRVLLFVNANVQTAIFRVSVRFAFSMIWHSGLLYIHRSHWPSVQFCLPNQNVAVILPWELNCTHWPQVKQSTGRVWYTAVSRL